MRTKCRAARARFGTEATEARRNVSAETKDEGLGCLLATNLQAKVRIGFSRRDLRRTWLDATPRTSGERGAPSANSPTCPRARHGGELRTAAGCSFHHVRLRRRPRRRAPPRVRGRPAAASSAVSDGDRGCGDLRHVSEDGGELRHASDGERSAMWPDLRHVAGNCAAASSATCPRAARRRAGEPALAPLTPARRHRLERSRRGTSFLLAGSWRDADRPASAAGTRPRPGNRGRTSRLPSCGAVEPPASYLHRLRDGRG